MLAPQLKKLKIELEEGGKKFDCDREELLAELNELDEINTKFQESLALSTKVCPTCGRRL